MNKQLSDYVQVFEQALPEHICDSIVSNFNSMPDYQEKNGKTVSAALDKSSWTEMNITKLSDATFRNFFISEIKKCHAEYQKKLNLTLPITPVKALSDIILKRYRQNSDDCFQPHMDAVGPVANRYMVFLWYLNDVNDGGETVFVDLNIKVKPKKGSLLMFPPYWMFQHKAEPPQSNDKYIISTYALHRAAQ